MSKFEKEKNERVLIDQFPSQMQKKYGRPAAADTRIKYRKFDLTMQLKRIRDIKVGVNDANGKLKKPVKSVASVDKSMV